MNKELFYFIIVSLIVLVFYVYYYFYIKENVEDFFDQAISQATTNNLIIEKDKEGKEFFDNMAFNYNYASLSNGSLQKINEIIQQTTDKINSNGTIIHFNQGIQPLTECIIDPDEFDDITNCIINSMNSVLDYKCFTIIGTHPIKKIKCPKQTKYQMLIDTVYKHPEQNEFIDLTFIAIIIHDEGYYECEHFCDQTFHDLEPDQVKKSSGQTYLDTLMLKV